MLLPQSYRQHRKRKTVLIITKEKIKLSVMQIIQYQDATGSQVIHRLPEGGLTDIKMGAQLIVQESQAAVFFRDGQALDTFGPGRHTLTTLNVPILTDWLKEKLGADSPFQASVVFVARHTFQDLKWGTREPIAFRDTELRMVRLRAFGKYAMRVSDPQLLVNSIAGTRGMLTSGKLNEFLRDIIVARLNDLLGENLKTVFDLPAHYDELAAGVKARTTEDFSRQGLELVDLLISAITPPEDVQKMIDERSGMNAVGDMDGYLKYKAAQSLPDAAKQPGGGAGQGMGLGFGFGLGQAMADAFKPDSPKPPAQPISPTASATAEVGITSEPDGAEIYLNGNYEGSTPSQFALTTGEHSVKVIRPGYKDWERTVRLSAGAKKTINAILEKA
jgi:membrane protease subunit (stomatin/prohibitin family)